MLRSYMILVLLFVCSMARPLSASAQSGSPEPSTVIDAERRIVQNLAEGLPRYEGVTIRYAFKMISEVGWTTPEDLTSTVAAHFDQLLAAELVNEGGTVLLWITTDGSHSNHEAYDQVLDLYGSSLARHSRTYALK